MAESLSSERAGSNVTRGTFMDYLGRYDAIEDELIEAQETVRSIRRRRKDLRGVIKNDGINLDEFDRARADAGRSGEEREAADRAYRQYMAWMQKPVGTQAAMDFAMPEPTERDLKRVEREGFDAGKAGDRADRNSYSPGTEAFARWHSAWLRGQAEKVGDAIKPPDAAAAPPKRRGRPPGSPNKPKANGADASRSNDIARAQGKADGLGGHRDHAARYGSGEPGHGDYELGHAEGQRERQAANTPAEPPISDAAAALYDRLCELAMRLAPDISIVDAVEELGADENAIKAVLGRLVSEGKLVEQNGVWYPPTS